MSKNNYLMSFCCTIGFGIGAIIGNLIFEKSRQELANEMDEVTNKFIEDNIKVVHIDSSLRNK